MKLVVDQQLPPILAQWLRSHGIDVWHVRELGLKDSPDHAIWAHAIRDRAIIISRDSDFVNFARQDADGRLVWVRIGNCSNPELISSFERLWPGISIRLSAGERLREIDP